MFRSPLVILMGSLFVNAGQVLAGDTVMGQWEGVLRIVDGAERGIEAQVVAEGGDRYRAVMRLATEGDRTGGESTGRREGKAVVFSGSLDLGRGSGGVCQLQGEIDDRGFEGECVAAASKARFSLKKVQPRPPQLGAKPPKGAVALLDGSTLEGWIHPDGQAARWTLRGDGSMQVTRGNILTRRSFGDVRIHLEFRTPLMPEARGQARGNSGVYVQGRYEVQVLDSFGLEPMDNGCGAIYRVASPRVNASLPPLQWQTYEIIFRAPRFDPNGTKIGNAEISVWHNGQLIHDRQDLPGVSRGGVSDDESDRGPLFLQDHRDPVRYRNIWILPLD